MQISGACRPPLLPSFLPRSALPETNPIMCEMRLCSPSHGRANRRQSWRGRKEGRRKAERKKGNGCCWRRPRDFWRPSVRGWEGGDRLSPSVRPSVRPSSRHHQLPQFFASPQSEANDYFLHCSSSRRWRGRAAYGVRSVGLRRTVIVLLSTDKYFLEKQQDNFMPSPKPGRFCRKLSRPCNFLDGT